MKLSSILLLVAANSLSAQAVAGRVVTLPGKTPVVGIIAALINDSSTIVTRAQTDSEGIFTLPAPSTGKYQVLLVQPDGGSFIAPALELHLNEYLEREFQLPAQPANMGEVYLPSEVDTAARPKFQNHFPRFRMRDGWPSQGKLHVLFVIDSAGAVEPGSIKLLSADFTIWEKDVQETLNTWRFVPAVRKGKKVRQVADIEFGFTETSEPVQAERVPRSPVRP